ncbi:MAG: prepilin peptidase [Candidatus Hydrogenedentes bacterium]|nr:prepilin peptidase [Candidatus Hydrogenedentota bacterium]
MFETPLWDHEFAAVQWGVVIAASLAAAFTDMRSHTIPNRLTLPLLLAGFIWAMWLGGLYGLIESLAACFVVALPFVILFVIAGGGAGDAKLMGAIGAWLGLVNGIITLVLVLAAGAVLGLAYAASKQRFWNVIYGAGQVMQLPRALFGGKKLGALAPPKEDMLVMPYGLAILCGTTLAALGVCTWHAHYF